jgi:hypothetical protein
MSLCYASINGFDDPHRPKFRVALFQLFTDAVVSIQDKLFPLVGQNHYRTPVTPRTVSLVMTP